MDSQRTRLVRMSLSQLQLLSVNIAYYIDILRILPYGKITLAQSAKTKQVFTVDTLVYFAPIMHVVRAAVLALIKFINFLDAVLQAVGIKLCKFTRENVLRGKSAITQVYSV